MKAAPKPIPNPMLIIKGLQQIAESVTILAKERTEQTRIREAAHIEIERIHAMRDVLLEYLDRSFDERKTNFDRLFDAVDTAIANGDAHLVASTLSAVVKLAETSPFKALGDIKATRGVLAGNEKDWEF